jgi:2'-5' RNA ligase
VKRATADNARLFVALWPDAQVRAALQAASAQWRWQPGAAIIPADRLHLTLHFLGDLPRERIPQLTRALELPFTPCALTLDRAALWHGGVAVLEPSVVPAPLGELRRALGAALRSLDIALETRRWRPHVTLARRANAKPPQLAPIFWPLRGHVLAESRLSPRTSYEVVASFD